MHPGGPHFEVLNYVTLSTIIGSSLFRLCIKKLHAENVYVHKFENSLIFVNFGLWVILVAFKEFRGVEIRFDFFRGGLNLDFISWRS